MKGLRKRKVDDLLDVGIASKKYKARSSNIGADPTKTINTTRLNGSFNELKVVLDRSIVHNYLGSKYCSRDRLELNSDKPSSTLRQDRHIQKNGSCGNNLEQAAIAAGVNSQKSCGKLPDGSFVITEPFDYVDDDLCSNDSFFENSILIKRDYSDEEVDVEAVSDSETNSTVADETMYTKEELTEEQLLSTTELVKIVSTDPALSNACDYSDNGDTSVNEMVSTIEIGKIEILDTTIISNGYDNTDNGGATVNEELKSQDNALTDRNERETQAQFENQNNGFTFKETIADGTNYYFCHNCKYKTTSKQCLYRHIRDNYTNKDGFIPCDKCDKKFRTENMLKSHKKKCGTKLYFTCKFCQKIIPFRFLLRKHIVSQHSKDFKMNDLDDIMKEMSEARKRRDMNENNFDRNKVIKMYCSTCNVIFERGRATVAKGCSKCDATLLFHCQMCGKTYSKISSMRTHIKWFCENAKTKLNGDATVISHFECEKNVIVHTKHNNLTTDKQNAVLITNGCDNTDDGDATVDEDLKSQDYALTDSNEIEPQTHFENQSNGFTSKEPVANGTNYYFCHNCKYKTTSKLCLYRHIRNNYTNKDGFIPCGKCNKKFRTEKILKCHEEKCGTKLYFTCKFCPKISASRFFLRNHIISQHPEDFKMNDLDNIMREITKARERRDVNEMTEVLKDIPVKNRKIKTNLDRNKVIKMYCSTCNVISERGRATIATGCSKCDTILMFQCQMCGKNYSKISAMRAHIKWSCKNAETKLNGDTTAISQFMREKNIIVNAKPNNLATDEQRLPKDQNQTNNNCKQCKKTKGKQKAKVCKHVEYKLTGCRYENNNAVCLKCNEKFPTLRRFAEHKIFCGVKILYPCPFCPFTCPSTVDAKRHIITVHDRKFDMEKLQDVINGIIDERNKIKEKYIADHQSDLEFLTTKARIFHGLDPAYKRFCTACGAYCNVKKNNSFLKSCPKCNTMLKYECQRCNEILINSQAAYAHSNSLMSLCKSIRDS